MAVDFAAVTDGGDVEGVSVVVEANPVVPDAEAELWRLNALKAFSVALAGGGEVGGSIKNAKSGVGWSMARSWAMA